MIDITWRAYISRNTTCRKVENNSVFILYSIYFELFHSSLSTNLINMLLDIILIVFTLYFISIFCKEKSMNENCLLSDSDNSSWKTIYIWLCIRIVIGIMIFIILYFLLSNFRTKRASGEKRTWYIHNMEYGLRYWSENIQLEGFYR